MKLILKKKGIIGSYKDYILFGNLVVILVFKWIFIYFRGAQPSPGGMTSYGRPRRRRAALGANHIAMGINLQAVLPIYYLVSAHVWYSGRGVCVYHRNRRG